MTDRRIEAVFQGRVQGVGFRATTCQIAQGFRVTGWVRNEPDGSVKLTAEGEPSELRRFLDAVGSEMASLIRDVQAQESPAQNQFVDFRIQR